MGAHGYNEYVRNFIVLSSEMAVIGASVFSGGAGIQIAAILGIEQKQRIWALKLDVLVGIDRKSSRDFNHGGGTLVCLHRGLEAYEFLGFGFKEL